MSACQDGLLPDGREGAIVPFGEEDDEAKGKRTRADLAQWLPMVGGIRKKIRNSGEVKEMHAFVVYEGDEFQYELGDRPFIRHIRKGKGGRGRKITHAYSVAEFKDGSLSRDVMDIDEIEDIRKQSSRAKKGPWSVKAFYPEMCVKTVVKHHAKSLPMSTDLDRLLHRDDALYDFAGAADRRTPVRANPAPKTLMQVFDQFASDAPIEDERPIDEVAAEEESEQHTEGGQAAPAETVQHAEQNPNAESAFTSKEITNPKNASDYKAMARSKIDAATERDAIRAWFASDQQRKLRNACGLVGDDTEEIRKWIEEKVKTLN
jgi:recombination protein RecT